jgi:pyruvate/2-oxoglutarate dehydrogenase complex dihydrolipoamide dehydrogenase (E3) component
VVILGAGREPATAGLGLERPASCPMRGAIPVDERCLAAESLWAAGGHHGGRLIHARGNVPGFCQHARCPEPV